MQFLFNSSQQQNM